MALYRATALVNGKEVMFQFWSKAQPNSTQNTIDACNTLNKNRDVFGKIQILKVKRITYAEMEVYHEKRMDEEIPKESDETSAGSK